MIFIRYRKMFFAIAAGVVALSIASIAYFGLPLSIDFTGGSLTEVSYEIERPPLSEIKTQLTNLAIGPYSLRESGEAGYTLRTRTLSPEEHEAVLGALSLNGSVLLTPERFTSIGPSLGNELATKALYALLGVIVAIVLYIAWAFRKVSRPISSWVYGGSVVLILLHDIIVPMGVFALFAYLTGAQVDTLVVVGLLAILGYSVNDTIVIFDRVREHLKVNEEKNIDEPFEETVGKSISETLTRSINTSVTVILALIALAVFGPSVTFSFTLVLLVGVIAGTYSSILVAAPLLIPLAKKFVKKDNTK